VNSVGSETSPTYAHAMTSHESIASRRAHFADLHHKPEVFVIPNPWDVGSARILVALGFPALATTSSGHAASLGKPDQHVDLDELLAHVTAIVDAVDVPVNVDAEHGFAADPAGVAHTFARIVDTGAAGASIEDYDPVARQLEPVAVAVERVAAASEVARANGLVLTARAENHLYGVTDLDDTIARLAAYRDAGADCVYAPGLIDLDAIKRVVTEVGVAVNVLALRNGPSVAELGAVGVRRVSTGGSLAFAAYGALAAAGRELLDEGTSTYTAGTLTRAMRKEAFGG
jgi:2-methylisocitrate lyase-like PEP mutase family enzyme